MPAALITNRLILRTWTITDLEEMVAINDDPDVMRFFPRRLSRAETEAYLQRQNQQYAKRNHAYFAAERIVDGKLLGFIGLGYQTYSSPCTPAVDIGWRLRPDTWGRGYAAEGARACLDYARDTLELKEVIAVAPGVNLPSIAVMRRIGMQPVGEFDHPNIPAGSPLNPCVWWKVEWRGMGGT